MKKYNLLFITLICSLTVLAQPGSLDSTFSGDGVQVTNIGVGTDDRAHSMVVQPDGKIVMVGGSGVSGYDFAIVRYNSDGTPDSTFGTGGIQTTSIGFSSEAAAVSIQSDGKIVVAGNSYNGLDHVFALVRYNDNGTLDSTFGTYGIQTTDVHVGDDYASSMVIQSDGKIVVAGNTDDYSTNFYFDVVRYHSDGTIDSTFAEDGMQITYFDGAVDGFSSIVIQSDGKIIAAGGQNFGIARFILMRYNNDGTFDSTFGEEGIETTIIGTGDAEAESVAVQSDGKIVAAGFSNNGGYDIALVRYTSNGVIDSTFGEYGTKVVDIGGGTSDIAYSIAIQTDGKIIVTGSSNNFSGGTDEYDLALLRYNSDGSLDNTFGTEGIELTSSMGEVAAGRSVVILPDGKILVGGVSITGGESDFAIFRYKGDTPACIANYTTDYDSTLNTFILNVDSATTAIATSYHWDFGDGSTSTLATPSHVYTVDSLYNVCMKVHYADGDSCTYCHTIGIDSAGNIIRDGGFILNVHKATTGISENTNNEIAVSIYPNPNTGVFQLGIGNGQLTSTADLSIYNVVGEKIYVKDGKQLNASTTIDLSDQPNGIYFMQLKTETNTMTKKIIINK